MEKPGGVCGLCLLLSYNSPLSAALQSFRNLQPSFKTQLITAVLQQKKEISSHCRKAHLFNLSCVQEVAAQASIKIILCLKSEHSRKLLFSWEGMGDQASLCLSQQLSQNIYISCFMDSIPLVLHMTSSWWHTISPLQLVPPLVAH